MAKHYGNKRKQQTRGRTTWLIPAILVALALIVAGGIAMTRPGQATSEAGGPSGSSPRVAVDREKLDFGKVKMNTPVTAAFKVKNTGGGPLKILGEPLVRVVEGC